MTESTDHLFPALRQRGIVCGVLLLLLWVACSCDRKTPGIPSAGSTPTVVEQIVLLREYARIMELQFPPGTRLLHELNDQEQGSGLYLLVDMPKGKLDQFIGSSPFAAVQLDSRSNSMLDESRIPWWRPESVRTFLDGSTLLKSKRALKMLIDLQHGDRVEVYLLWFYI